MLAVALTAPSSPPTATGEPIPVIAYALPVRDGVPRNYVPPGKHWQPGHHRVGLNASSGQPTRTSAPGVVHFTGSIAGMAFVSIVHANGIRTTCQPTDTAPERGGHVAAGQVIGHLVVNIKHPEPGLH